MVEVTLETLDDFATFCKDKLRGKVEYGDEMGEFAISCVFPRGSSFKHVWVGKRDLTLQKEVGGETRLYKLEIEPDEENRKFSLASFKTLGQNSVVEEIRTYLSTSYPETVIDGDLKVTKITLVEKPRTPQGRDYSVKIELL